jgi:hypothetical protein
MTALAPGTRERNKKTTNDDARDDSRDTQHAHVSAHVIDREDEIGHERATKRDHPTNRSQQRAHAHTHNLSRTGDMRQTRIP